jgi:hypothetical protein
VITSKKLLAMSFFISIVIFFSTSHAADQILATVTSDTSPKSYQLEVATNDQDQVLTSFFISNFSDGNLYKKDELPINIFIKNGIKLGAISHFTLAKISCSNFDQEQGGMIIIDALYNALTGKRKRYELFLAKDVLGWKLFHDGHAITQIIAKSHKIPLFGVVGTEDLIMK